MSLNFSDNIVMCKPSSYDVTYTINPWMNKDNRPNKAIAHKQWTNLHHLIIRAGGFVHYIQPSLTQPDMVFTANAALVHNNKVALAHFANKERQGEESHFRKFFQEESYLTKLMEFLEFSGDEYFEGQGDAFIVNETLFLGTNRTKKSVAYKLMDFFGLKKLVFCELIDPRFYHLDTCFCPLNKGHVIIYPGAFSETTLRAFETEAKIEWLSVTEESAKAFACNAINIGDHVIIPYVSDKALMSTLKYDGYAPETIHLDEFIKAGGAAKCLTLKV